MAWTPSFETDRRHCKESWEGRPACTTAKCENVLPSRFAN